MSEETHKNTLKTEDS